MKPKEKYGNCTEQGCVTSLNAIQGLDDNVTIGELRAYLEKREKDSKTEFLAETEKLINSVSGKCFKIVFSPEHTVLLKITSVSVKQEYGYPEGILVGEQIVKYKGEVRYMGLDDDSDKKYSNYFPNEEKTEITLSEFEKIKSMYNETINLI